MKRSRSSFWRNDSGAAAVLYALALPALVAIAGLAFDYARLAAMDTELQNAADQAALAAATQLDDQSGACARAATAASSLVSNSALLANDGEGPAVTIANESGCDATGVIRFWQTVDADGNGLLAADADANAKFIEIVLAERTANYALTPIVGAFKKEISAAATAGLSGAVCGTAALSYCNTSLPANFNPDAYRGRGVLVGTMSGSGTWGYLMVPPSNNHQGTELVLAQDRPVIACRAASETPIALPGSASGLVRAINTRFDIFNNNISNPNQPCANKSDCAPAANVIKDVVKLPSSNNWVFPVNRFSPKTRSGTYSPSSFYDADGLIDAMGLPRDLCHYGSYGSSCSGLSSDLGNGEWARADYFNKYHSGRAPANANSITRYETYRWEVQNNYHAALNGTAGGSNGNQYSLPVTVGASTSAFDRRVITVAFSRGTGGSCPGANAPVPVLDWVDMFFVEPGVSSRGNYPAGMNANSSDPIYMEIIGRSRSGSTGPQLTRRDTPYLVR